MHAGIGPSIVILLLLPMPIVFGHSLGGESHPPISINGRNVTLSINISPPTFDAQEIDRYITISLKESKSEAIVEHVTYVFEMTKEDKSLFRDVFHDDLGNLVIMTTNDGSDEIKIHGDRLSELGAWIRTDTQPIVITGPVFDSGGLYEYKIEILTIDSDSELLDKRIELAGAISLSEKSIHSILDSNQNVRQISVISYFDTIKDFAYDGKEISFVMPFNWNQDFEQINVVHQEITIPHEFSDFLYTRYDTTVNGIKLDDESVTIDDYSSEGRTIHIVLNKNELNRIKEQAMNQSDSQIFFEIGSSKNTSFPLQAVTPDIRYQIHLSWEPQVIRPGKEIIFFVDIEEVFSDHSIKQIEYDFIITHNDNEIFKKHIQGLANSENPDKIEFLFSPDTLGTIKIHIKEIEGSSLSNANFLAVVKPQNSPEFPIRLDSMSESNQRTGKYRVDLTWFPNTLDLGDAEFVITFYDRNTGIPVKDVSYDFVLIRNGSEIYRMPGSTGSGGTFEDLTFVKEEIGDLTLRIEKIKGTNEYVEVPITVTPEFPIGIQIVLIGLIAFVAVLTRTNQQKMFKLTEHGFS